MLYSILPIDNSNSDNIKYQETSYMGQKVLLKIIDDTCIIERLYSTNPKDFLNPHIQPGTILENPLINQSKECYNEY